MGKSFTTAVKEVTAEAQDLQYPFDFTIDGHTVRYRAPGDGEVLLTIAAASRHVPKREKLAAVVNLFSAVLDPKDGEYIIDRLMDPEDSFGPTELFGEHGDDGILADMTEEWAGHPTQP